jgi:hypothetical protein
MISYVHLLTIDDCLYFQGLVFGIIFILIVIACME